MCLFIGGVIVLTFIQNKNNIRIVRLILLFKKNKFNTRNVYMYITIFVIFFAFNDYLSL